MKKYYFLIPLIIANIGFLWLAYKDYGRIKITMLHFAAGIIPTIIVIARFVRQQKMNAENQ
jgi:hypothetical protein